MLSVILGALIGYEREYKNMPAGLRTHTLVCMGATLVQITSIDIFSKYHGIVNVDPARLGAQVISGIGFLGAGTIIHEGASIKGLTTAAGLWVVACIGLAIGNGSYIPAILGSAFAYMTLKFFKMIEVRMSKKNPYLEVDLSMNDMPGQIGRIGQLLGDMGVNIKNMSFKENHDGKIGVLLSLKLPSGMSKQSVVAKIMEEDGVHSVEEL
jgi:Uncharacterized membrane protein